MFVIIGIVVVIAAIGARQFARAVATRGIADHRRRRTGYGADCQPAAHPEKDCGEPGRGFGGSKFGKARYLEIMKMLYELFTRARKEGLMALETDSDNPEQSPVFSKYPKLLKDHHVMDFICDTIRMAAGGGVEPFDVDQMMELDMEVHDHEAGAPVYRAVHYGGFFAGVGHRGSSAGRGDCHGSAGRTAGRNRAQSGGSALGTFLGILLCYGFVGPIAANMAKSTEGEHAFYHVIRVVIVAFIKGAPASVAVEFGRRAIPGTVRPKFQELEDFIKNRGAAAEGAAAAEPAAPAE